MYKEYYKLDKDPFKLTPDAHFVFAHRSFRKARAHLQHTLEQSDGFLVITGRPGTGKTTLVEDFLAGLNPGGVVTANVVSTNLQMDDMLRMVVYAFGLDARGLDKPTLLCDLKSFLTNKPRALLIVDEAQNLSTAALEELRMLTNLHTGSRPLLQIILLAQEELQQKLHTLEMEQLHQRVMATCCLEPLSLQETRDYVLYRLSCAGWRGDPAISNSAFVLIYRFSQGLPRYINKLCGRLLLHGMMEKRHLLDVDDLVTLIRELQDEQLLPLAPEKPFDIGESLVEITELIGTDSLPADWISKLTSEERELIELIPVVTAATPAVRAIPSKVVSPLSVSTAAAAAAASEMPVVSQPVESRSAGWPELLKKAMLARLYDLYKSLKRRGRKFRIAGKAGITDFRFMVPVVLAALYLMISYNTGQQPLPVRVQPADSSVNPAAAQMLAADDGTEVATERVIVAVDPRVIPLPGNTNSEAGADAAQKIELESLEIATAPELAAEGIAASPVNLESTGETDSTDAFKQPAETSMHIVPVAESNTETFGLSKTSYSVVNATGSALPGAGTLRIGSPVMLEHPMQTIMTSVAKVDDNGSAEPIPALSPVDESAPGISDSANPARNTTISLETDTNILETSLAGTTTRELDPAELNRIPSQSLVSVTGAALKSLTPTAASDPTGLPDTPPEHPMFVAQQVAVETAPAVEPLPSVEIETHIAEPEGIPGFAVVSVTGSETEIQASTGDFPVEDDIQADTGTGNKEIAQLLLSGEQAISKNRLRLPEDSSAWHYFSQVLKLDPGNQAAQEGLQKIAARYGWLARNWIKKQQYAKAELLINRGLGVVSTDGELLALRNEVDIKQAELLTMKLQREARLLAEAANRSQSAGIKSEPEPDGFFGSLKRLFTGGEAPEPGEFSFQNHDR